MLFRKKRAIDERVPGYDDNDDVCFLRVKELASPENNHLLVKLDLSQLYTQASMFKLPSVAFYYKVDAIPSDCASFDYTLRNFSRRHYTVPPVYRLVGKSHNTNIPEFLELNAEYIYEKWVDGKLELYYDVYFYTNTFHRTCTIDVENLTKFDAANYIPPYSVAPPPPKPEPWTWRSIFCCCRRSKLVSKTQ